MLFDFWMLHHLSFICLLVCMITIRVSASPNPTLPVANAISATLARRTDPTFPPSPASCGICQQSYPSISSCAQAAPVLANVSMIIFNPGAFIDVIKCACADTFESAFPQCVDCFTQTGQQDVLNTPDLPGLVQDIRQICGLESTLLGNVSAVNSATPPASTSSGANTAGVHAHVIALVSLGLAGMMRMI